MAELETAGFSTAQDPTESDVIIAHSGGCFMLPDDLLAKLILLIDIPNWPEKHPIIGTRDKIKLETKNWWWATKTFYNSAYLLTKPMKWHAMNKNWKVGKLPSDEKSSIILLRNDQDTYMHHHESSKLSQQKGWKYLQIPGQHDDIWENPKPYVDLIKKSLAQ